MLTNFDWSVESRGAIRFAGVGHLDEERGGRAAGQDETCGHARSARTSGDTA
jgi:hypothetical protein